MTDHTPLEGTLTVVDANGMPFFGGSLHELHEFLHYKPQLHLTKYTGTLEVEWGSALSVDLAVELFVTYDEQNAIVDILVNGLEDNFNPDKR